MPQNPYITLPGLGGSYIDTTTGGGLRRANYDPGRGEYSLPDGTVIGNDNAIGRNQAEVDRLYGWVNPKQQSGQSQLGFINKWTGARVQDARDAQDKKAQEEEDAQKAFDAEVRARLQKFIDATMSLDPHDQYAQQVAQAAQNDSSMRSEAAGLGRQGISQYASDLATKNALGGYQMQRQQMGMQGLGMLQNQAQYARNSMEGRREFDLNFQNQLDQQRMAADQMAYQSRQGMGQGIGSAIGGGLGAIGGFLVGGPVGAAVGGSFGAGLGGGLGGLSQGGYSPRGPSGRRYNGGSYGYGGRNY